MRTLAVVPVKNLSCAKSRLSFLGMQERRNLVLSLLTETIDTLRAVMNSDIVIIGSDRETKEIAARKWIFYLEEKEQDLNTALFQSAEWAEQSGYFALLVVPIDLPLLVPNDIFSVLELAAEGNFMVIAPNSKQNGTNLLCIRLFHDFRFCFGADSYRRHLDQAAVCGMKSKVYYSTRTCLDLDTYNDWLFWEKTVRKEQRTAVD